MGWRPWSFAPGRRRHAPDEGDLAGRVPPVHGVVVEGAPPPLPAQTSVSWAWARANRATPSLMFRATLVERGGYAQLGVAPTTPEACEEAGWDLKVATSQLWPSKPWFEEVQNLSYQLATQPIMRKGAKHGKASDPPIYDGR